MVKLGDKGSEVSEIQKYLSFLGYDLIVDGHFGDKTLRSLKAFQKKVNLDSDGISNPRTIEALKAAQKRTSKEERGVITSKNYKDFQVIKEYQLDINQYIKQQTSKDKIFIHFTAGSKSAINTIRYWNSDEPRVSTSYVIAGDGSGVYECFNPDYWSFHLGVKGTNGSLDKTSIGIEICSYGPLKKVENKYFAWPKNWTTEVPESEVYKLDEEFRGYRYFQAYSDEQLSLLEKLIDFLIVEYEIPVQKLFNMSWFEFNQELIDKKTPGIWTHTNVRKDKSDSYPDKRLLDVLNKLSKKYNK